MHAFSIWIKNTNSQQIELVENNVKVDEIDETEQTNKSNNKENTLVFTILGTLNFKLNFIFHFIIEISSLIKRYLC